MKNSQQISLTNTKMTTVWQWLRWWQLYYFNYDKDYDNDDDSKYNNKDYEYDKDYGWQLRLTDWLRDDCELVEIWLRDG